MNAGPCPRFADLDRHFAGRLGPPGEHDLRGHLVECTACRGRYRLHLQLAKLDPAALSFEERMGRGLGLRGKARLPLTAWFTAAAGVVALGAFLLVPLLGRDLLGRDPGEGLRARGGAGPARPLVLTLDRERTEVIGFLATPSGAPALATGRIGRMDELAFAYRNGGPWRWLMVFARDERGAVYWYQPQWTDPAADPSAVPISPADEPRELAASVAHDLGGRQTIELCALVSVEPTSVRAIERALGEAPGRSPVDVLARPGQAVACRTLEVSP